MMTTTRRNALTTLNPIHSSPPRTPGNGSSSVGYPGWEGTCLLSRNCGEDEDEGLEATRVQPRAAAPTRVEQGPKLLQIVLVIILLVLLALALSACAYPGQDPPCSGARRGEPGCANPATGITDAKSNGTEWYVDWIFKAVRNFLADFDNNAVKIGVSIFWGIFTNLGSTDFASCGSGGATPTCAAAQVFSDIRVIAFALFPAILVWRFFKGYFIGSLIEAVYESGFSVLGKALIGGFALAELDVIISAAFGLSNVLFEAILGGAETLNQISQNILGTGDSSGVGSVTKVDNIGLLLVVTFICVILTIVFILLGLVFFLRTILVFILFALSPLAAVAGLTDEFREWFHKWLSSLQAMLIAPIPVAICFTMIKTFTRAIPSAHDNPPEFVLQLIYVIAFLAMGSILMFKIAGQIGGALYGAVIAGAAVAVGVVTGGASLALSGKGGNGGEDQGQGEEDNASASSTTKGKKSTANRAASSPDTDESGEVLSSGGIPSPAGANLSAAPGFAAQQSQQFSQMMQAMRSLNESMQATMQRQIITLTPAYAGGGGSGRGMPFSQVAHNNALALGHWAGHQAGVSSPYLSFAPYPSSYSSSGGGAMPPTTTTESYSYSYSRQQEEAAAYAAANPVIYRGDGGEDAGYSGFSSPTGGGGGGGDPFGPAPAPLALTEPSSGGNNSAASTLNSGYSGVLMVPPIPHPLPPASSSLAAAAPQSPTSSGQSDPAGEPTSPSTPTVAYTSNDPTSYPAQNQSLTEAASAGTIIQPPSIGSGSHSPSSHYGDPALAYSAATTTTTNTGVSASTASNTALSDPVQPGAGVTRPLGTEESYSSEAIPRPYGAKPPIVIINSNSGKTSVQPAQAQAQLLSQSQSQYQSVTTGSQTFMPPAEVEVAAKPNSGPPSTTSAPVTPAQTKQG